VRFFQVRDDVYKAYSTVDNSQMILRDFLAIDRTILANQSTFLAYLRTALTLFVAGVTFVKFFDTLIVVVIGWTFIPVGVATFFVGLVRYNRIRLGLERIWGPDRKIPG
jgi:putative membrane protein